MSEPARIDHFTAVLIPARVYTGDRAELHCTFSAQPSLITSPLTIQTDAIPTASTDSVSVYSCELSESQPGMYVLNLAIQVWRPGAVTIPPLTIDPFTFEFPTITVASIVQNGETAGLQPMRRPLVVPGTVFRLYGAIIGIIVAALIAVLVGRYLYRSAPARAQRKQARRRLRRLHREFLMLRRFASSVSSKKRPFSGRQFCTGFESATRCYLASAFPIPATAYTTDELIHYFDTIAVDDSKKASVSSSIATIFSAADRCKFDSQNNVTDNSSQRDCSELLDSFERLIPDVEFIASLVIEQTEVES